MSGTEIRHTYTVLYLENDPFVFARVAKLLSGWGFILHVAENGREGLRLFEEVKPDIVITEIKLPHLNGLQVARHVKERTPRTQVVITSVLMEPEYLLEAINIGVTAYLPKQVDPAALAEALEKCARMIAVHDASAISVPVVSGETPEQLSFLPDESLHIDGSTSSENPDSPKMKDLVSLNADLEFRLIRRSALLDAARKELDDLCDAISHDINGPLSRLQGFSQLLIDEHGKALGTEGELCLERIVGAGRELKKILDGLMDLAQLSSKGVVSRQVDLSSIAMAIVNELRAQAPERRVNIFITPGLSVIGDEELLRKALGNLLDNAWKFTAGNEDVRIEFGCAAGNGKTVYFVRDNGVGFDMHYASKLFRPFQRVHDRDMYPGNGLGLAAVERIIRRHGGRIWFDAEQGRGATFYFTL